MSPCSRYYTKQGPTGSPIQSGILRKAAGPTGTASLVDVYGTLLSSRLFIPSDPRKIDQHQLSLHLLRRGVDTGQLPLPIFTAIQPGESLFSNIRRQFDF